ncbi:MAG: 4-deoxy-4-formamido-L-arabinose-phosphoundecaprenol deformylase [Phycisphaerae bacterium]|nr:4-deoxy-4-formamido-L-arabinose-phosphoundecaprenol deformylase [Phycisphaerae bacterium]
MSVALRIDVDTFSGTRDGVPRLLSILERRGLAATWYFTVGPDNMGRHLWRLLRPRFALKMLRSKAASLYGWEILLRGTLWSGPEIGRPLAEVIRRPIAAGHEFGVHAWDHHRWQRRVASLPDDALREEFARAFTRLAEIAGREPETSATPGWRTTERVLAMKTAFPLRFNSDCRGAASPFRPRLADGRVLDQLQIPVDLPTYDEAIGTLVADDEAFNAMLLARLADGAPHVLTIHAESEGGAKAALFEEFLDRAAAEGHRFEPLGRWLDRQPTARAARLGRGEVAGREGWLGVVEPPTEVAA